METPLDSLDMLTPLDSLDMLTPLLHLYPCSFQSFREGLLQLLVLVT